jgi:hypothetical protein
MLCSVANCRFPTTHITKAHTCGKCHTKGHGILECGSPALIAKLLSDQTKISPGSICCIKNCKTSVEHLTIGHYCLYCKKYSHDEFECPEKLWNEKVESETTFGISEEGYKNKKYLKIRARNLMNWNEHKIYVEMYEEMGCIWYAKRDNLCEKIKLFFMHSDEWGQYGSQTDRRPKLAKFISGYERVVHV